MEKASYSGRKKHVAWDIGNSVIIMSNEVKSIANEINLEICRRICSPETVSIKYYDGDRYSIHKSNGWLAKYKWPDGSIHCNVCVLDNMREVKISRKFGRLWNSDFLREEDLFLQEIQQKLDIYNNNMREGVQEYVQLSYQYENIYGHDEDSYLYIFRDGTVYANNYVKKLLLENSTKLYDSLLNKMKQGSEGY